MSVNHKETLSFQFDDFITAECDMVDQDELNEHSEWKSDDKNIAKRHQFGSLFSFKECKENLLLTNKGKMNTKFDDNEEYKDSTISNQSFEWLSNDFREETIEVVFHKQLITENSIDGWVPSEVIMRKLLK